MRVNFYIRDVGYLLELEQLHINSTGGRSLRHQDKASDVSKSVTAQISTMLNLALTLVFI